MRTPCRSMTFRAKTLARSGDELFEDLYTSNIKHTSVMVQKAWPWPDFCTVLTTSAVSSSTWGSKLQLGEQSAPYRLAESEA
jgi:hypothetical protein